MTGDEGKPLFLCASEAGDVDDICGLLFNKLSPKCVRRKLLSLDVFQRSNFNEFKKRVVKSLSSSTSAFKIQTKSSWNIHDC